MPISDRVDARRQVLARPRQFASRVARAVAMGAAQSKSRWRTRRLPTTRSSFAATFAASSAVPRTRGRRESERTVRVPVLVNDREAEEEWSTRENSHPWRINISRPVPINPAERTTASTEALEPGVMAVRLPCMHVFEAEGILEYLRGQDRPACPVDQTPVLVDEIDMLPVWRWTEADALREGDVAVRVPVPPAGEGPFAICAACRKPIERGQFAVRLPCLHMFHAACALPNLESATEPVCLIDGMPVAPDEIARLPVWPWGREPEQAVGAEEATETEPTNPSTDENPVCGIDLSSIREGEIVVRLECGCVHHAECLMQLVNGGDGVACPNCRSPMTAAGVASLPMWRWGSDEESLPEQFGMVLQDQPPVGEEEPRAVRTNRCGNCSSTICCADHGCLLKPGEDVVRLPCMHVFHSECIQTLFADVERPCCPIDKVPVAKRDVDLLPTWKWSEDDARRAGGGERVADPEPVRDEEVPTVDATEPAKEIECVVCLCAIEHGEEVVRLPCLHVFHSACLVPYLESEENPRCPIDRTEVPKDLLPNLPIWKWGSS